MTVLAFDHGALPVRFWAKVQPIPFPTWGLDGCWIWTGATTSRGYGSFNRGRDADGRQQAGVSHKMTYEAAHGPIARACAGARRMVLDHRCRTRCCVNPAHLELVLEPLNVLRGESPAARHARKTQCPRGHAYTPENTYVLQVGGSVKRYCRACRKPERRQEMAA